MRISDRFIDYGSTGAFFLIGQFILLALWGQTGWLLPFTQVPIQQALLPTLNSLLAVLGITVIFFFGLFLDLVGPVFFPLRLQELVSFKVQVDTNKDWLTKWKDEPHNEYLKTGYEDFQAAIAEMDWRGYVRAHWQGLVNKARDFFPRSQVPQSHPQEQLDLMKLDSSYFRLRYFMQSYILINSGLQQLDTLTDQIHLWRTSRAICAATAIWLIEATIAVGIGLVATIVGIFRHFFPALVTLLLFILIWIVLLVLTLLTLAMARSAFSRMCSTLFSLAQITHTNKGEARPTDNTTPSTQPYSSSKENLVQ